MEDQIHEKYIKEQTKAKQKNAKRKRSKQLLKLCNLLFPFAENFLKK